MVLADPFPGSNIAMRSISKSYREYVRNYACQEGRNFAPVQTNKGAGEQTLCLYLEKEVKM